MKAALVFVIAAYARIPCGQSGGENRASKCRRITTCNAIARGTREAPNVIIQLTFVIDYAY